MIKIKLKHWWHWFKYRKQKKLIQALMDSMAVEMEETMRKTYMDTLIYGRGTWKINEEGKPEHIPYKPFKGE